MDAGIPSSSWHPALMPNSAADVTAPSAPVDRPAATATDAPHETSNDETDPIMSEDRTHTTGAGSAADAWLTNDEVDEEGGGAWFDRDEVASSELAEVEDVSASVAPQKEMSEPQAKPTTSSGAQHSSSMSFARTVSHDLNFNDDDDGDWNLSRTDTDPFKFMPPTDRTNSFPVVQPTEAAQDATPDAPLSTTQASQVLSAVEDGQMSEPVGEISHRAPSRSIGGEIPDFEGQEAEARYEEALPLLSSDAAEESHSQDEQAGGANVLFGEDDGGDDFFSNVADPQNNAQRHDEPPLLERKSTMQVVGGALGAGDFSRQSSLGGVQEMDEDRLRIGDTTPVMIETEESSATAPTVEDVSSKWQEAFAGADDDDDFLLEDTPVESTEIDASAFLGSDDEGFLDDDAEDHGSAPVQVSQPQPRPSAQPIAPNPYLPQSSHSTSAIPTNSATQTAFYQPPSPSKSFAPVAPPIRSEPPRMQSFADKSKGGYASPYDLPTDLVNNVVKPRKRTSMQQLPQSHASTPQPTAAPMPRSASMFAPAPPPATGSPSSSSQGPPLGTKTSVPVLRNKGSFFEELPMAPKPRPSSRQSNMAPTPSTPPQASTPGHQLQEPQMLPPAHPTMTAQQVPPQQRNSGDLSNVTNLVAPEKVSPYAGLQAAAPIVPAATTNTARYSPAPAQQSSNSLPPSAIGNRYSPAPSIPRSQSSYSAVPAAPVAPQMLPHQPRTSSPLAQFEINRTKTHGEGTGHHGESGLLERRASAPSHEPRLNRIASLPPTREVDEEDEHATPTRAVSASVTSPPPSTAKTRYSPVPASNPTGAMSPPPSNTTGQGVLSPPGRAGSNYMPQPSLASQAGFVPPPRAQTQSPSSVYTPQTSTSTNTARPASAHSHTVPAVVQPSQITYAPVTRPRGASLELSIVPPNDSRAQDPLQRWKGAALLTWGLGGTVVTCFPKSVPRYGLNQTTPSIIRSHGEVKVGTIKDIDPLQDRLAKFPGPLKGKSKKKETLAWLTASIETIEKDLPDVSFHSELSLEAKRSIERLLLWKLLRVFIEYDGVLEGSAAVEKAVRDILAPGAGAQTTDNSVLFPSNVGFASQGATATSMSSDGADASAMEKIRADLLQGNSEGAVWAAVDKRLWGHAMLISQTISPDLYKRVAQEFVRKEVNHPGHQNESLGALYKILSGNHEDCVDELVPSHARAGLQLVSAASTANATGTTADGLDKWRETLSLVLGNRTPEDVKGLRALGNLLASYGRAEAAHICYMFSRSVAVFGGLDDPNADYVLLGSDHRQQSDRFAKEMEALELSEVFEYGLTLSGTIATASGSPHLAAYKLQHAMTLAEYGYRDQALQYCDAIFASMTAQTRRSPYHHALLESAVDDLTRRLKQAPKEESGSWMSKPSMNKLSGSLLSKFNTFVSGDETDETKAAGEGEGHFARIASTPNMSRSPSVSNFEMYGTSPSLAPGFVSPPGTSGGSKYAPLGASLGVPTSASSSYEPSPYAPLQSGAVERSSGEYQRNAYTPGYSGPEPAGPYNASYTPVMAQNGIIQGQTISSSPSLGAYSPQPPQPPGLVPQQSFMNGHSSENGGVSLAAGYEPPSYGTPPTETPAEDSGASNDLAPQETSGGYEPPSYGYQPPSYEPDPPAEEADDNQPQPKKKSFMDDDEDDIPSLRPGSDKKSRADVDRENQEMFRKAAEEDAKRAAAQASQKKGWGFGGWFGGAKKADSPPVGESNPNKPVRAKLGEASSFVYDPELKRWINKKPGAENVEAKTATPPPPRAGPRSVSGTPPPPSSATPPPPAMSGGMPPPRSIPTLSTAASQESLSGAPMARSVSNTSATGPPGPSGPPSRPPSRPTTSMSNASSIDDLLGAAGPRRPGQKKPRKSGRYVDVMAK